MWWLKSLLICCATGSLQVTTKTKVPKLHHWKEHVLFHSPIHFLILKTCLTQLIFYAPEENAFIFVSYNMPIYYSSEVYECVDLRRNTHREPWCWRLEVPVDPFTTSHLKINMSSVFFVNALPLTWEEKCFRSTPALVRAPSLDAPLFCFCFFAFPREITELTQTATSVSLVYHICKGFCVQPFFFWQMCTILWQFLMRSLPLAVCLPQSVFVCARLSTKQTKFCEAQLDKDSLFLTQQTCLTPLWSSASLLCHTSTFCWTKNTKLYEAASRW